MYTKDAHITSLINTAFINDRFLHKNGYGTWCSTVGYDNAFLVHSKLACSQEQENERQDIWGLRHKIQIKQILPSHGKNVILKTDNSLPFNGPPKHATSGSPLLSA